MFSYQSHKRFEWARKKDKLYKQSSSDNKKILFLFKDNQLLNCWRFEKYYEKVDGMKLHQLWARGVGPIVGGEGPIVRHLCSEGRCVNPIHLVRGSWHEYAKDEIKVRNFENELMMNILNDRSMEGEDKDLIHSTLLPKMIVKQMDELGCRLLREVEKDLRELFRKDYVQKLVDNLEDISEDKIQLADIKLDWLINRPDVYIITVPGK